MFSQNLSILNINDLIISSLTIYETAIIGVNLFDFLKNIEPNECFVNKMTLYITDIDNKMTYSTNVEFMSYKSKNNIGELTFAYDGGQNAKDFNVTQNAKDSNAIEEVLPIRKLIFNSSFTPAALYESQYAMKKICPFYAKTIAYDNKRWNTYTAMMEAIKKFNSFVYTYDMLVSHKKEIESFQPLNVNKDFYYIKNNFN